MEALKDNWLPLVLALIALAEVVVNLTPSKKDNSILLKIKNLLGMFIPNVKKGGGKH